MNSGVDRGEFDAMFRDHYPRLVCALGLGSGSFEDAADAVQDAFIELYARWERVSSYDDPVGWVRRVAVNRLAKRYRSIRRGRAAMQKLGQEPEAIPDADTGIDIDRAMEKLSPQQRMAVALHYLEGLTVVETAKVMGLAKGTVDRHLYRARHHLRPHLEVEHG